MVGLREQLIGAPTPDILGSLQKGAQLGKSIGLQREIGDIMSTTQDKAEQLNLVSDAYLRAGRVAEGVKAAELSAKLKASVQQGVADTKKAKSTQIKEIQLQIGREAKFLKDTNATSEQWNKWNEGNKVKYADIEEIFVPLNSVKNIDATTGTTKQEAIMSPELRQQFTDAGIDVGLTKDGDKLLVEKDTDTSKIMGFVPEKITKTQTVRTEEHLRDEGLSPATPGQIANPALKHKIRPSEDTKRKFIKLEKLPVKTLTSIGQINDTLVELDTAAQMMIELGLSPSQVGRIPLIGEFINVMTKNGDWQAWKATVEQAFQKWKLITTGVQASDKELRALEPLMPSSKDVNPVVFMKKTMAVMNAMYGKRERVITLFEDSGYDVAGARQQKLYLKTIQVEVLSAVAKDSKLRMVKLNNGDRISFEEADKRGIGYK